MMLEENSEHSGGLALIITPSFSGSCWKAELTKAAHKIGWRVNDYSDEEEPDDLGGLAFVYTHEMLKRYPQPNRAVIIDTTATDLDNPGLPAPQPAITLRSQSLVEAELAARDGALVLNASRYVLNFPQLGVVERPEGPPYRIHPTVANSPLAVFDDHRPGAAAIWSPLWFNYPAGFTGAPEAPMIDLTGRMRALVYGPYFHLSPGRWKADVTFTVDPEKAHAPLLFEWGGGNQYRRIFSELRRPGVYHVSLNHVWETQDAAQLRIWPAHPVFQGWFGFQGCKVSRMALDDPMPLTPSEPVI